MAHQSWVNILEYTDNRWYNLFAMFGTTCLYIIMYSTLHTRVRPQSIALTSSLAPLSPRVSEPDTRTTNRAARYMIIYPTIYVLCTLPLAAGRVVALTGLVIPYW
jgi:hypothetical protein